VADAELLGIRLPEMEEKDLDFAVDPDNWEAVMTFCRCGTQWSYGVMGDVIGLRYEGVKALLDLTQPKKRHNALIAAIQAMEQAALKVLNKSE
jgi:hypothetical protein